VSEAVDKVGGQLSFKIQVAPYEPLEVAAWAEITTSPMLDEAPDAARKRAWEQCWNEVGRQVVEQLKSAAHLFRSVRPGL